MNRIEENPPEKFSLLICDQHLPLNHVPALMNAKDVHSMIQPARRRKLHTVTNFVHRKFIGEDLSPKRVKKANVYVIAQNRFNLNVDVALRSRVRENMYNKFVAHSWFS